MTRCNQLLILVATSLALGACATLPQGGITEGSAARPYSDMQPQNAAQARAKINVELGMAYLEVGRFDVALDEARAALGHDSSYPPAYHLMGLVYMLLEDIPAARENLQRALRGAPNDPDFNNSYGWFLCANGSPQEGLKHLNTAVRNPYYRFGTRAYTNAGLCYLKLNDDAQAAEQFRRALSLEPNNVQAMFHLASIAYRQGDYLAARQQLIALHQRREPTAESAWLGLRTERRLGNRESEASYAAQLRGRFSDSAEYRSMMQGQFE